MPTPRSLDDIVQEHFGTLHLTLCRLQAENEALLAKVAELEARLAALSTKEGSIQ